MKLVLLTLLVAAGLAVWLGARFAPKRISERLFVWTCAAGIVSGVAGLAVTFGWPDDVVRRHLWEAAAMPLVLFYAVWWAVLRNAKGKEVLDEKQDHDLTSAAALAGALMAPAMGVAFGLSEAGSFDSRLWFPYFLFMMVLMQSAATLYRYRRS